MGESTDKQKVIVVGAGPVGALAALYAAGRGDHVEVYELRSGMSTSFYWIIDDITRMVFLGYMLRRTFAFIPDISGSVQYFVFRSPGWNTAGSISLTLPKSIPFNKNIYFLCKASSVGGFY